MEELLPIPIDLAVIALFLLAGTFCIMTTAATSVSMEGKELWLVKSLPLTARTILDWENEVSVVKQSASAILGGVDACLVPEGYSEGYRAVLCVLLLGTACLMYRKNNRIDLWEL